MIVKLGILLVTVSLCHSATIRDEPSAPTEQEYRLKQNLKDLSYEITLKKFNMSGNPKENIKPSFTGDVTIKFQLTENATTIRIHADPVIGKHIKDDFYDEKINKKIIKLIEDSAATTNLVETLEYNEKTTILTIISESEILKDKPYTLSFTGYKGQLYDDMHGAYLSMHKIRPIVATQFQPTHARRVFPCFDEPEYKATFTLQIEQEEDYNVLSNTDEENPGSVPFVHKFKTTPKMSTYLLAFTMTPNGEYAIIKDKANKYSVHEPLVYTKNYGQYAAKVTPDIVEKFGVMLGKTYTQLGIEKLDQIAIPDFSAGAMENWGLITYRETALLCDTTESTTQNMQRVAAVIAHELAHQWFGNYHTLTWWAHTWLNEGFARFFEYHMLGEVEPDWEMELQFVVEQIQAIMVNDGMHAAPLTQKDDQVLTETDVKNKFGSISYNKGASIIRMMWKLLFKNKDQFYDGLKDYIKDGEYDNVLPTNLFTKLEGKANIPADNPNFEEIMKTWTEQPGYPVIDVKIVDNGIELTQKPFHYEKPQNEDQTQWIIPVKYQILKDDQSESPVVWMYKKKTPNNNQKANDEDKTKIVIPEAAQSGVLINPRQEGYYRINYGTEMWNKIQKKLASNNFGDIDEISRSQILDDMLNLARAGDVNYKYVLDFMSYLKKEDSYYVWYSVFNSVSFLRKRLATSDAVRREFSTHIEANMEQLKTEVGRLKDVAKRPGVGHVDALRNVLALKWLCEFNEEECKADAIELFSELIENAKNSEIKADYRSIIYCAGLRHSKNPKSDWNYMFNMYKSAQLATTKATLLTALGCTTDVTLLTDYITKTGSNNGDIKSQDAVAVFNAVLTGNPEGVQIALDYLTNHFSEIKDHYVAINAVENIISSVSDRLTGEEQYKQFEKFLEDNSIPKGTALETAKANLAWSSSLKKQLEEYFDVKTDSATTVTSSLIGLLLVNAFIRYFA